MSALNKDMLKKQFGLPPMPPVGPGASGRRNIVRKKDYAPVYWDKYFEHMHSVKTGENDVFRVYECGTEGPVLLFLHGGGFSALSWSLLSSRLSHLVKCRCTAIDLRGHGDTETSDDADLSADRLSKDVKEVIESLYGEDPPPIILIGHSMGGAIAVHVASQNYIPSLIGLCVIDVVEGTAMDALSSMQSFLRGRPKQFKSLDEAIEWCVRSGQVRNLDSAKVSMVGQVKRVETNETATKEMEKEHESHSQTVILEEEEEEEEGETAQNSEDNAENESGSTHSQNAFKTPETQQEKHSYTWRINLTKTEHFWPGWFQGLSQKFLSCEVPKLLLLAGVDRLDKDLTIGQMQGKFQMQVLPQCGHAVHEDVPEKVADVLATFMIRHRVAEATDNFEPTFPAC
ncbi:protein phosphatase methylesterase 1-like [Littorina saxatilis]|uniref:protein phosphatase methylesterase 1-like n=1 Tax=Littorina saxatilis TaxID=31220 RepID=UPI0038B631D9